MKSSRLVTLVSAMVLAPLSPIALAQSKQSAPPADDVRAAQLAWGSDPAKRCPDLRQSVAPEGAVAVVQFLVGPTGAPSRAAIRSSSGSTGFDAAATSCILKLRFLPVTRIGDAVPVESWQQLALKWQGPVSAPQTAHCEEQGADSAQIPLVVPESADSREGSRDRPGPAVTRAGVCVCVDENGKIAQKPVLTNSSGNTRFDTAALELSSAAHYRPAIAASGQPTAGCFRFRVAIEVK
jgi:TonB family protein